MEVSVESRFRLKRFAIFLSVMDLKIKPAGSVHIADLGGTLSYWKALESLLPASIANVTIINLDRQDLDAGRFQVRHGDATDLKEYADRSFDIVHSNSVIEHVGQWREMERMAGEIHRLAPRHFIQTPNFWFPFEPHYRRPLYQFLPSQWRASRLVKRKRGFMGPADTYVDARSMVDTVNLLSFRDMAALFPRSIIHKEKLAGFTKSLIAVV